MATKKKTPKKKAAAKKAPAKKTTTKKAAAKKAPAKKKKVVKKAGPDQKVTKKASPTPAQVAAKPKDVKQGDTIKIKDGEARVLRVDGNSVKVLIKGQRRPVTLTKDQL